MEQEDIKKIVADNIAYYRKAADMTQTQLAERLNYSDKSVSKWERSEGMPDVVTLCAIADIFGITANDLLNVTHVTVKTSRNRFRLLVALLSAALVWLVAVFVYVIGRISAEQQFAYYLAFIYALPVSGVVGLVFSIVWRNRIAACIAASVMNWGLILSIFLSTDFNDGWLLFIAGIPVQIVIFLLTILKKSTKKFIKRNR